MDDNDHYDGRTTVLIWVTVILYFSAFGAFILLRMT